MHITKSPTHAHTSTLRNKLKQPHYQLKQPHYQLKQPHYQLKQTQYKLKQTQYKIYPNEIVTI